MNRVTRKACVIMGCFILVFAVISTGFVESAPLLSAPPDLERLIQEGLAHNKELESLEAKVAAAREMIPYAGSLEDPRLGIGLLNLPADSFRFNQEPMTQKQISISQKIPWFSKLSLREQRQTLVSGLQQAILETKRFELARQISEAYYELGFASVSLDTNARLRDMVEQIIRVAETRYASGSGLQQDVLQAQVELSKLLDEKIALKRKRRTLENRINGLLNREDFEPVTIREDISYSELNLDLKALQERSLKHHPGLRVKQLQAEIAASGIQLAQKDYWPDMNVTVAYGQRDDDPMGRERADFVSAMVSFNLPLWQKNRQDRNLSARHQDLEAAQKSFQNLLRTLPHRADTLVTEITDLQENYRLFSDALMLQAEHWARSSLSAYAVGKVEFNTMINAQIRLIRFELQAQKYLYSLRRKRAELEELLGGPLDERSVIGSR